jgi:hypothetical protein
MQVIIDNEAKGTEVIDCVTSISRTGIMSSDECIVINFKENSKNKTRFVTLNGYTTLTVR